MAYIDMPKLNQHKTFANVMIFLIKKLSANNLINIIPNMQFMLGLKFQRLTTAKVFPFDITRGRKNIMKNESAMYVISIPSHLLYIFLIGIVTKLDAIKENPISIYKASLGLQNISDKPATGITNNVVSIIVR
jgi:hypothetical protein